MGMGSGMDGWRGGDVSECVQEKVGRSGIGPGWNPAPSRSTSAPPFLGLQGCVFVSVCTLGAKHSCLPAITMATHPDRSERRGRPLPLPGNAMLCQALLSEMGLVHTQPFPHSRHSA